MYHRINTVVDGAAGRTCTADETADETMKPTEREIVLSTAEGIAPTAMLTKAMLP